MQHPLEYRIKTIPPELLIVSNSEMVTWFNDFIILLSVVFLPRSVLLVLKGYEETDLHNSPKVILR